MKLRHFTVLWLIITAFMSYEYLVLNKVLDTPSALTVFMCGTSEYCKKASPQAGRPISYALGWLGFSIMALTNVYIIRKRSLKLQKIGNLQNWLNWHIFFGLLGPTFVLFHTNFKVGGLVAISFWSMVISFLSGIVGRFFYIQLLQNKVSLRKDIEDIERHFDTFEKNMTGRIHPKAIVAAKSSAFAMAGGMPGDQLRDSSIIEVLARSAIGSLRVASSLPRFPWPGGGSREMRLELRTWALLRRRLITMHYYQLLFGYWRTFHSPFAIWMYVVAIIHIISSLIFKVN